MRKLNFMMFVAALVLLPSFQQLHAQEAPAEMTEADLERTMFVLDSIDKSFKWQTGKVDLPGDMATIDVPANMRYLNAEQSLFVLTQLWGNPPDLTTSGMLFPLTHGPMSDSSFAFNIGFEEMGYVKDSDADETDYDELLADLKKGASEGNKARVEAGFEPVEIVGWASQPYYDKDKKVLHWAKEIKFGDGAMGNTLNYDLRFLGRKGVLSLNAISSAAQLNDIKSTIPAITNAVSFKEGHRYADYDSNIDNVAAWTLGGLVAGKVLAKAGFFAIILKFIKPLILGVGALGAWLWNRFKAKKEEGEEQA
jgi:uncharacterized membrane-anchored protein